MMWRVEMKKAVIHLFTQVFQNPIQSQNFCRATSNINLLEPKLWNKWHPRAIEIGGCFKWRTLIYLLLLKKNVKVHILRSQIIQIQRCWIFIVLSKRNEWKCEIFGILQIKTMQWIVFLFVSVANCLFHRVLLLSFYFLVLFLSLFHRLPFKRKTKIAPQNTNQHMCFTVKSICIH